MTANEMKFALQLQFDSLFEFSAPAYDDRQISYLLTKAQFRVFIKKYNPFGDKYKEGFEGSEKRRVDLEQLITNASVVDGEISLSADQTGVHPKGYFYDMPVDFLYATEEGATYLDATSESWVKPVRHDEYQANKNNPYKQPYKNLAWRMDYSRADHGEDGGDAKTGQTAKRIELISYGPTFDDYRVRYLASPPAINVDEFDPESQIHCILDNSIHEEIVDEAVVIAQAATQKDAYKIGLSEQNRAE